MCRNKSHGGRRCGKSYAEYSAEQKAAHNERRRIAYAQKQQDADNSQWREYGFTHPRLVRRGLGNSIEAAEILAPLEEVGQAWRDSLTREQDIALNQYTMGGFEYMNPLCEGEEAYRAAMIRGSFKREEDIIRFRPTHEEWRDSLDQALKDAPKFDTPRILYRSVVVRDEGVDASDHVKNTISLGDTLARPGYLSTSLDSDFTFYYAKEHGVKNIYVMEILSSSGGIVHERQQGGYSIQDDEREVLLGRNTQLKVVGIHHNVPLECSREIRRYADAGTKRKFTVVQVVEESLLESKESAE